MFEARGISVRYPGASALALRDVSFTLARGELLAVAGPNGSGKTTLQRALLGLLPLAAGEVTLDGRPIAAWPRQAVAEAVGALPQREEPLFPVSVRESVMLGRWATLGPLSPIGAADELAVQQALVRCDLAGLASRGIDVLSGGEWQRVRLARALASSPRLLLLDEPTASLDVGHEMEIFELLRDLVGTGLGVMVITHDLNLAARFADRIILVEEGRLAALGTPREVLTADLVSRVFRWPVEVTEDRDGHQIIVPMRRTLPGMPLSRPSHSFTQGRVP